MDFKEIFTSQLVIYSGAGFILLIAGMFFNKKKREQAGKFLSMQLRRMIGKENEKKVEEILEDVVEGMKSDNK